MRNLLLSFFLLCIASSAGAKEDGFIYGAGIISCGKWSQLRSTGERNNTYAVQTWVDGFLSGWNIGDEEEPDFLIRTDRVALYAWIDNYCGANPLDNLTKAIFSLRTELLRRAKQ